MSETASTHVEAVGHEGDVSQAVVMAVAEAKGIDPLELEPLYDIVDPDALNRLFRPSAGTRESSLVFQFTMAGCAVEIHGDGEVSVTPQVSADGPAKTIAPGQR